MNSHNFFPAEELIESALQFPVYLIDYLLNKADHQPIT